MVAAVLQDLLSPDLAKEHAVDLRIGVLYNADVDPGTQGPGNTWTLQADLTPRFNLPAGLLVSLRNRVPIAPFVNAELVWQQQPAMWTQFRMQAGVQAGFDLFAQGQTVEESTGAPSPACSPAAAGRRRPGSSSPPTSDPCARIRGSPP